jgi:hypothetical protein
MTQARHDQSATLLPDGRVLIAGGSDGQNALSSAELYNPATGTFTPAGSMGAARDTAVLLKDGRVLMIGGEGSECADNCNLVAEVYDEVVPFVVELGVVRASSDC